MTLRHLPPLSQWFIVVLVEASHPRWVRKNHLRPHLWVCGAFQIDFLVFQLNSSKDWLRLSFLRSSSSRSIQDLHSSCQRVTSIERGNERTKHYDVGYGKSAEFFVGKNGADAWIWDSTGTPWDRSGTLCVRCVQRPFWLYAWWTKSPWAAKKSPNEHVHVNDWTLQYRVLVEEKFEEIFDRMKNGIRLKSENIRKVYPHRCPTWRNPVDKLSVFQFLPNFCVTEDR